MWNPLSILVAKADVREKAPTSPTLDLVSNYSTSSYTNLTAKNGPSPSSASSRSSGNLPVKVKNTIVKASSLKSSSRIIPGTIPQVSSFSGSMTAQVGA